MCGPHLKIAMAFPLYLRVKAAWPSSRSLSFVEMGRTMGIDWLVTPSLKRQLKCWHWRNSDSFMNLEEICFSFSLLHYYYSTQIGALRNQSKLSSLTHPFMGDAHPSEITCNHSMSKVEISTLGREEASANAASFLSPSTKSSVTLSLAELGMIPWKI